jgi:hypothetical protein
MGLVVKESGNSIDPVEEGLHQAICFRMYDLGTQYNETFGTKGRKVLLMWELPGQRIQIERDGEKLDLPRAASKQYTMSLHKKANLRHDLESWRGKKFTQDELDGFDITKVLGANCTLQIQHETKGEKTYANITNVLPLVSGQKREAENTVWYYSISEHPEIPADTPEWVSKIIMKSEEMRDQPAKTETTSSRKPPADDDSDIPF